MTDKKRYGGSPLPTIITLIVIAVAILFVIPIYRSWQDLRIIKKAVNQTATFVRSYGDRLSEGHIRKAFFSELDRDKLSVEFIDEDLIVEIPRTNRYRIRARYFNEYREVPILKIRLRAIDRYIETEEIRI